MMCKHKYPFVSQDIVAFLVIVAVYSTKNFKDGIILKSRNESVVV
jgi:hypothetical protein